MSRFTDISVSNGKRDYQGCKILSSRLWDVLQLHSIQLFLKEIGGIVKSVAIISLDNLPAELFLTRQERRDSAEIVLSLN